MGPEDDLNIGRALSQKWSSPTPPSDGGLAALISAVRGFNQFVRNVDPQTLDPDFFEQAQILLADTRWFVDELERDEKAYPYRIIPLDWSSWRGRLIDRVLHWATGELCIAPSSVKNVHLFVPTDIDAADFRREHPINGAYFVDRKEIALSCDLDAVGLVETTAHELAHHAGLDEVGAEQFAAQFVAEFGSEIINSRPRVHVTIGSGPHIVVKTGGHDEYRA